MATNLFTKDPEAVLDYAFDWSDWLATGETISSHTITTETGITKDSDSEAAGVVTVWLSSGTAGTNYRVECKIVTSAGRTDERTIWIKVTNR
jgi:hypothetical protein